MSHNPILDTNKEDNKLSKHEHEPATKHDVKEGGAIGAVGGAVVGAATDPCDLNLGDPFWRDNGGRDGYYRRCGHEYRDR